MYNPYTLKGKTIMITGASSGIGRAVAIECSRLGAKVILVARNRERLQETLGQLEGVGHQYYICDLVSDDAVGKMISQLPALQGVALNAGITKLAPINFMKKPDLEEMFSVNTFSPILLFQRLIKEKKLEKGSSAVFTSSISALGATAPGEAMYISSKGAITSFVRVAALEMARRRIRVNAVCPGMVDTDMAKAYDYSVSISDGLANYPLGRYATPQDIAYAIIFLLSNASSWITGTNLVIDGGLTTK